MKRISFLLILIAGILWGSMGIFVRTLNSYGLVTMDIVFLRAVVTAVLMIVYLVIFNRKLLIIRWKDLWCFLGTGVASITFFNYCYFKAITVSSLSIAAVLLYTAPAIVMVLSFFLFRERFTWNKTVALIITFIGCILVTGAYKGTGAAKVDGVLYGLGAGLGYALYSIFSRYALERGYHSLTITCYTFVIAAVATAFMGDLSKVGAVVFTNGIGMFLFACAFGILCTILPYLLYTLGLSHVENSKASIIASIEPVTATIIGIIIFHENLDPIAVFGMVLVLGAMAICSIKGKQKEDTIE